MNLTRFRDLPINARFTLEYAEDARKYRKLTAFKYVSMDGATYTIGSTNAHVIPVKPTV